jgi:long-chain acyl-CoA synthetase
MSDPLFRLWTDTVERAPSAVAVVDAATGRKWTRGELSVAATEWARAFARPPGPRGLSGRRVAMATSNGPEWFHVFLGLMSEGAVPAPIDPSEPEESQSAAARSIGAPWIWRAGVLHAVDSARSRRAASRAGSNECLVKMTSGSTGAPKGLPVTHGQLQADGRQICLSMGIGPEDINLASIPLGYSYGLGNLVLPLLLQGSPVVCASSALPQALASDSMAHRPTVFPTVPPVLRALVASDVPRRSFASVRLVVSAGSPLAPDIGRSFLEKFGVGIHGFYGTTETGGIAFDATGEATLTGRSAGTPMSGVTLKPGSRGRFTVSSSAVSGNGRFSPADRGSLNENGELVLLGRSDRVVKIAGRRVNLAEIESAMRSIQGVRDAFVQMIPGPDPTLAAAAASGLRPGDIRRQLRAVLASWKVPSRIVALPEFPATVRGKTDARALGQLLSAPRTVASISTLSAERHISAKR